MTLCELGPGRMAHASGALWLPDIRTALLADVHLGFGWALRRRRQLGPVGDGGVAAKLAAVMSELQPETVVFLGDLVHAPRPTVPEREMVEGVIRSLTSRVVVVLGNHDRGFTRDFPDLPLEIATEWRGAGITAVHGDKALPDDAHVAAGHLHPALGVTDHAGASHKMPVFLTTERITLLPAFSPLASGWDVRAGLPFDMGDPRVVAASGRRAVALGRLSRLRSV